MKKVLLFVILLLIIGAAVPVAAEEEIINISATYNEDGTITFTGSNTVGFSKEDMVSVYKDGDDPENNPKGIKSIFFYQIGLQYSFSVKHPGSYCITTNRNVEFINEKTFSLKPGKYFAVIKGDRDGHGPVLSNRAYFTVPNITATPTATVTPIPPTPTISFTPSSTIKAAIPTPTVTVSPTAKATTPPVSPVEKSSSAPMVIGIILGIIVCIESAIIVYLITKKK